MVVMCAVDVDSIVTLRALGKEFSTERDCSSGVTWRR